MVDRLTHAEILKEARDPHVTADMLNILVTRTRELSALKEREAKELHQLLEEIEAKLAAKS